MNIIPMNNPIFVDVDGTLVRDAVFEDLCKIDYTGQLKQFGKVDIEHPLRNETVNKNVMIQNLKLVRDMHARGRTIVVWSQAGYQWAEAVCKALELDKLSPPIIVCEKPIAYIDDLEATAFMGQRIFLND